MPQVGPLELAVVAAVALIVFGPHKLPELARTVGKALGELRRMASEIRDEFEGGLESSDDDQQPEPPVKRARNPEDEER